MTRSHLIVSACSLWFPLAALAASESEGFDGGVFTNPRIVHAFEFENCCWAITDELEPGNYAPHLDPNTDDVTFDFDPVVTVTEARVRVFDSEGGFTGLPTTAVVARGKGGDFLVRTASALETWETISFSSEDPGQLTGLPIGPIVSVSFQASNENYGAYIDDIVVDPGAGCYADFDGNGALDLFDFLGFTNAFNAGEAPADCDANGAFDLFDFLCFTNAFNAGC